ncbi:MAG: Hsp70 family protein, partial [Myxococcota bacterium]
TFVRALVRSYREHLGHDHVRLIVSVPAQTEDAALAALRGALREAEVEAFRLEPDPQVVFRAYSLEDRSVDTALCVDVEPQALTLTLAQKSPHGLRSVEVHRSPLSSARAFDQRVAELGLEALAADGGPDLRGEAEALASVRTAVENARPDFRRNPTVDVRAELPHPNGERSEHTIHISRSDVEEGSEDLVASVCREVQTLLQRHELSPADVDAVVCAGSTGRYPHLVTALGGLVGAEPLNSYPANQVKLYGLLKEARALERRARNVVAPGTLVASIGVELPGGRFRPLVHAGTELPTSLERSLPPPRDGGSDVELVLYQGEGELARLCTHLGHLRLDRLPRRAPPALQLQLDVDADGVLTAQMRETQSRRNARLRVATQQTSAERRRALAPTPTSAAEPRKGLLSRWFGG